MAEVTNNKETVIDLMTEEQYAKYMEYVNIAIERKKAMPRKPREKKVLTDEQKVANMKKQIAKYTAMIEALMGNTDNAE